MKWATDIYKEGIQPADTLSWTGSQNDEAFIAGRHDHHDRHRVSQRLRGGAASLSRS